MYCLKNGSITWPRCQRSKHIECICDDIQSREIWKVLSLEFFDDTSKSTINVGVLYGLKSTRAYFLAHLAKCMQEIG